MFHWGREKADEKETPVPVSTASHSSSSPKRPISQNVAPSAPQGISSLEEALLEAGAITPEQLDGALTTQQKEGGFLGQILVDMGVFNENSFTSFLAKQCRIPHLSLLDYLIEPKILALISRTICQQYRLLPIDKMGRNLTVAMVNPLDKEALAAVQTACPDLRIKPILCAFAHYESVARKLFAQAESEPDQEVSLESLGFQRRTEIPVAPDAIDDSSIPALEDSFWAVAEVEDFASEILTLGSDAGSAGIVDSDILVDRVFVERARTLAVEAGIEVPVSIGNEEFDSLKTIEPAIMPYPEKTNSTDIMRDMISVMQESMCDTYAMLARRMDLFQGLKPEEVAKLFAKGVTVEHHPGEAIFVKGQPGREMFVILGGKVEVRDEHRVLATLSKGDMVGEMAFVSREPRSATVMALEPTSVLVVSRETIHRLLSKDAAIQILENIIVKLCARLRLANLR